MAEQVLYDGDALAAAIDAVLAAGPRAELPIEAEPLNEHSNDVAAAQVRNLPTTTAYAAERLAQSGVKVGEETARVVAFQSTVVASFHMGIAVGLELARGEGS